MFKDGLSDCWENLSFPNVERMRKEAGISYCGLERVSMYVHVSCLSMNYNDHKWKVKVWKNNYFFCIFCLFFFFANKYYIMFATCVADRI